MEGVVRGTGGGGRAKSEEMRGTERKRDRQTEGDKERDSDRQQTNGQVHKRTVRRS